MVKHIPNDEFLNRLFNNSVHNLEQRIKILENQIADREALNLQIQTETDTRIGEHELRIWHLRYHSLFDRDSNLAKHHGDILAKLRQQKAIENVSAWKDVSLLQRLQQETRGELERAKVKRQLMFDGEHSQLENDRYR